MKKKHVYSQSYAFIVIFLGLCAFTSASFAETNPEVISSLQNKEINKVSEYKKYINKSIVDLKERVEKLEKSKIQNTVPSKKKLYIDISQFILLAIPVVLIAYLGNIFIKIRETITTLKKEIEKIRINYQDRKDKGTDGGNKKILKSFCRDIKFIDRDIKRHTKQLLFLCIGDVLLIVLVLANILHIYVRSVNHSLCVSGSYIYDFIIYLFILTILYLCVLHCVQWFQIICIWNKERKYRSRTHKLN